MNNDFYILNTRGQRAIRKLVREVCKPNINPEAFFADAESAFQCYMDNDEGDIVEISGQYTLNGRPFTFNPIEPWFERA